MLPRRLSASCGLLLLPALKRKKSGGKRRRSSFSVFQSRAARRAPFVFRNRFIISRRQPPRQDKAASTPHICINVQRESANVYAYRALLLREKSAILMVQKG